MTKAAKKKSKAPKKSARVTAKPKAAARSAKTKKPAPKKAAARKKIDPLNRTNYRSVTPMLSVSNVRRAIDFYTAAFGYKVKQVMDTPQGVVHAELTLRDTTLMLSPESRQQNNLSANTIGNTPVTLYVMVEDADNVFARAVGAGAGVVMPVSDMFWGDRCGMVSDPDGNKWMLATHKSEPTEAEMAEAMRQMSQQAPAAASAGAGD
jgi:PhnB protein